MLINDYENVRTSLKGERWMRQSIRLITIQRIASFILLKTCPLESDFSSGERSVVFEQLAPVV